MRDNRVWPHQRWLVSALVSSTATWTAYAAVSFGLFCVGPLLQNDQAVFTPIFWRLNAAFLLTFLFGGIAVGLVASAAAVWLAPRAAAKAPRSSLPVSASAVLAVAASSAAETRLGGFILLMLLFMSLVVAAMLWAFWKPRSAAAGWFQFGPLVLWLLVLGPYWFCSQIIPDAGIVWKVAASAAVAASIGIVHACTRRYAGWPPLRHCAVNLALLAVLAGAGAVISASRLAMPAFAPISMADPKRPPVVLISLDTTGTHHLSTYGYSKDTSPYLSEFARTATQYTSATAPSDMTLSSHASMFTGVYPSWHGAHGYSIERGAYRPLDGRRPTLAGMLSARGYATAGVAANRAYLSTRWGLSRGFQFYSALEPVEAAPAYQPFAVRYCVGRFWNLFVDVPEFDQSFRTGEEINRDVFQVASQPAFRNRSFFLFVNYMDAHPPLLASAGYRARFPGGDSRLDMAWYLRELSEFGAGRKELTEHERRHLLARYDAGIAYQDMALHELLEWLKAQRLYDQSLIMVTADHGEAFGERNLLGHGTAVYGNVAHVPLVIKFPNQKSGAVVNEPVSGLDVMPTVLEIAGQAAPPFQQGVSLLHPELLAGREIFSESFPRPTYGTRFDRIERSIQVGPMKLIMSTKGKSEFYDLAQDPGEVSPRAGPERLEQALRAWIQAIPARTAEPNSKDTEERRRLKSLGYIQ